MRDPDLTLYAGERYEHENYGTVEIISIKERILGMRIKRNENRATTAREVISKFVVNFNSNPKGGRMKQHHLKSKTLEDFQQKIND